MPKDIKKHIQRHVDAIAKTNKEKIYPREDKVIELLKERYPSISEQDAADWACDICFNEVSIDSAFKILDKKYPPMQVV